MNVCVPVTSKKRESEGYFSVRVNLKVCVYVISRMRDTCRMDVMVLNQIKN